MSLLPSVGEAMTPVFFLSHGGPTFMYSEKEKDIFGGDIGAFRTVRAVGQTVIQDIKPKFILYVSAHWQSKADDLIEVAVPKSLQQGLENELIYDFYGFPEYMYHETFHSENDLSLADDIVNTINHSDSGLRAKLTERGIDHGVWVPLKVAFPDDELLKNNIPLIQVSLARNDYDFDSQFKLGQILSKYRDKGGLVLTSGMSVHNLRDMGSAGNKDYNRQFTTVLNNIVLAKEQNKLDRFKALLNDALSKELLLKAHPTLEHFVPIIVALGAAEPSEDDLNVKELYNKCFESLGWGVYQFGDLL
ncbi:unnamed protein product [Kluyveromyces dobzhanskii CBS 2104]|uniref:WGS project CCBQ000000000 data, contig 00041 n=1 Tax=Kluyveromyces dobzhanskii CBS 2104 TaxID=1427455 RepID=A0A0A8L0G8_9SACH|nr:unnamed protein product [Kluyveromyces dobzhanskii CBS 2104]